MSQSPYKLTEDLDVSIIYVDTNLYDEFVKLNQSLDLTRYNYLLLRKTDPEYWPYVDAKEEKDFDFETLTFNASSYLDENKTMTLQELTVPDDFDGEIKYYLDGVELNSSTFVLENASIYTVSAITSNSSIYEDDTNSAYSIIYEKVKRTATLSFANATVNTSSFIDQTKTITLQEVSGLPTGQTANYYLDSSLLSSNSITLSNAGNYVVSAKIENSSYYNDASASYSIVYTKEKRDAVLSFANSVVNETVEDVTEYTGNVQQVSGAPQGVNINYYLGNTLLTNGQISIDNLQEGENTFIITAKIENDLVYNDTSASYELNITMEISSYENKYFTAEAIEPTTYKVGISNSSSTVSYSSDNGTTWTTLASDTSTGEFAAGSKVLFKGNLRPTGTLQSGSFRASGKYNISGNIKSLFFGDDFKTAGGLNNSYLLTNFFKEDTNLVSAENLIMPSDFRGNRTCDSMFYSCTSLVTPPQILPATALSYEHYKFMFYNCTSLTNAPKLPATTLNSNCYINMFTGCTSLVNAPELPATTLASSCYQNMFSGCTSLVNAPELPATKAVQYCYNSMFKNCTSLVNAPELPATTLASNCYQEMFAYCYSLVNAPELPATTLVYNCYYKMFNSCRSLNYIKAACPPNLIAHKSDWVGGVAATGTYIISDPNYDPNTDGILYNYNCVPQGWTVKDYQGNIINPKLFVSFTNPNNLLNRAMLNEQFAMPSYQIRTNISAAASEVVYYYSTDNSTWTTTIPQYLNTTTEGTFTYYIKAEISNSAAYTDTTEVYTYTYKVVDYIRDFSAYTCLNDIEDISTLLDTNTLQFNDCILDLSSTLSNGTNVFVQLRDTVTNQTSDNINGIRTFSATGNTDFNVKENRIGYKIQDVGLPVLNHSGYYQYHFTNTMQIFNIQANVNKAKVYFKLPNYNVSNSSLELSSDSVTLDYDSDHPMGSADLPTVDIISGSGEYIISDFYYIETGSEPNPETGEYDYQEGGVVFAFIDEESDPPCIKFEFSQETGSGGYSGYFIITDVQTEQEVQLNVETIGDVNTGESDQYDNED